MAEQPQYDELARRIEEHLRDPKGGKALVSATWHGYLGALLEWGLITPGEHGRLVELLPPLDPNPVLQIFLGN
jgi:hypothetical protein